MAAAPPLLPRARPPKACDTHAPPATVEAGDPAANCAAGGGCTTNAALAEQAEHSSTAFERTPRLRGRDDVGIVCGRRSDRVLSSDEG